MWSGYNCHSTVEPKTDYAHSHPDTERSLYQKSWDQFIIHKPFGKLVIAYGKPIYVPKDADDEMIETYRLKLEKNLNELHEKAENLLKV